MNTTQPTLVILAAGMGSRYGGLKQIDTFSPQGDTITDFSIYDAIKAGFKKIVFIIRKDFEKDFRAKFDEKLKGKAEVVYVFQELDAVPSQYINTQRVKPWGTGHALLMTKDVVKENFAIINADDFYGKDAFKVMADFLKNTDKDSYKFSMVAYLLKNTVSDFGQVSRGICTAEAGGFLKEITEQTHIQKDADGIKYTDNHGNTALIDENTIVSMNFWGFTPKCFEFGEQSFNQFLKENEGNLKAEFYLPVLVTNMMASGKATVQVLTSDAKWFGVTYPEDKAVVEQAITEQKISGLYPEYLWK